MADHKPGTASSGGPAGNASPLDKARAARKAGAGTGLDLSDAQKFAVRQLQTLAGVARLASRKIKSGGNPSSLTIDAFARTAQAAINELSD